MLLCTLILEESFNLEELGKWARVCPGLVGGKMSLPIDLVDGEQLLDKLKELGLGVNIKKIEQVSVVPEFFKEI